MSKRNKLKYPALHKSHNTLSRKDYIEVDYINGIKNSNGEMVIRPLNDKELSFLNQWYEETIVTNFAHHPRIKFLQKKKKEILEDAKVLELKQEIKEEQNKKKSDYLKVNQLRETIQIVKQQNEELYYDELQDINLELEELREEHLLYPDLKDHKQFYSENNSRNSCLYNMKNASKMLNSLDEKDYDKFLSAAHSGIDTELALIQDIERMKIEKEEDRQKKMKAKDKKVLKLEKMKRSEDGDESTDSCDDS